MMEKLKYWPSEYRAVATSAGIVLVALVVTIAATQWYKIGEEREWIGESVYLVEGPQIASPNDLQFGANVEEHPLLATREFRARMLLTLTGFLALTACGIALLYCLPKVMSSSKYRILYLAIVIPFFIFYLSRPATDHMFPIYQPLLDRVECFRTLEGNDQRKCAATADDRSWRRFTKIGNASLFAAAFAIAASLWLLLSRLPSSMPQAATDEKSLDLRKMILRQANQGIMVHLYLLSALLAVSVIALHSYFSWPAVIVPDNVASELRGLASVIAITFGSGFTLLIVALIGPAIYVINKRTEEMATEATQLLNEKATEGAARSWREKNGFVATSQQKVMRMLATIGPMLAGPVLELLNLSWV
jgi:hypothetical protein